MHAGYKVLLNLSTGLSTSHLYLASSSTMRNNESWLVVDTYVNRGKIVERIFLEFLLRIGLREVHTWIRYTYTSETPHWKSRDETFARRQRERKKDI